jgi:hypothetical protein
LSIHCSVLTPFNLRIIVTFHFHFSISFFRFSFFIFHFSLSIFPLSPHLLVPLSSSVSTTLDLRSVPRPHIRPSSLFLIFQRNWLF